MTSVHGGAGRAALAGLLLGLSAGPVAGVATAIQPPPAGADSLLKLAEQAYETGTAEGAERAIALYAAAVRRFGAAGDRARTAEALAGGASIHNELGRPDSALAWFRGALAGYRAVGDRAGETAVVSQIGEVHHGKGDLDSAVTNYRAALALARATGDSTEQGYAHNNLGIAHHSLGRPDSAEYHLERALALRRGLRDRLGEGVTLNNLGLVQQTIGRPDSAIAFLRQSLAARREIGDRGGEANVLNNLGYSFELLDRKDSALAHYVMALPVAREVGRRSLEGIILANRGRVRLERGELDVARSDLVEGLTIKRDVGDRLGASWALNDLGRTWLALGRRDSGVAYLAAALAELRAVGDRAREGETLYNLGQAWHRGPGDQDLGRAVAYYDSAATIRRAVGTATRRETDRLSFAEQNVRLFEEWTLAWLARAPELGAEEATFGALAAAERGRAQALLDLMRRPAGAELPPGSARPAEFMPAEGRRLVSDALLPGAVGLFLQVSRDTLLAWVLDESGVSVHRTGVGADSVAALAEMLRAGLGVTGAAEDFPSEWRGIAELERPPPAGGALRGGGGDGPRRGLRYAEASAPALAELLLPLALESRLQGRSELVVFPQGPLALVPFAVLPLGRLSESLSRPFGAGIPIRYAPSLAALVESEGRARSAQLRPLVVGNPVMPTVPLPDGGSVRLPPLPHAEAEAAAVASRFGASPLVGAAATEAAVRAALPGAGLVHLATHGFAYGTEARAGDSFVALAPGGPFDGLLTVTELLADSGLALSADLVVLSACQTGLGDLKQAEGTVGLQRALLARGARSVLVSLWAVSDEATDLLMRRFYQRWGDDTGPSKAQALDEAQADVRATPGFEHPRFWAAFQLVGAR